MKYSACAECEIIHFVNCEISHFVRCEMKFAFSHLRSKYFTAKLFHMAEPYFTRRRRISLKKAHIVLVDKCVLFSGRGDGIRTHDFYVPNVALYQTEPHLVFCFWVKMGLKRGCFRIRVYLFVITLPRWYLREPRWYQQPRWYRGC